MSRAPAPKPAAPAPRGIPLAPLLAGIPAVLSEGCGGVRVRGVTCDSRQAAPGSLFVAIRGTSHDGHDFLPAAAAAGAAAAIVERPAAASGLPCAQVADARKAAGPVAAAFFGHPSDRMRLAGITGTNGKTTTAWLLDGVLHRLLGASLLAGTVAHRVRVGRRSISFAGTGLTTREAPDFQRHLAEALAAGCTAGAVECSSHGLAQSRLAGTRFRTAVFTNLTRDHLDFHPDLESYFAAKRLLFTDALAESGTAVISLDDPFGSRLAEELARLRPDVRVVGFGHAREAEVRIGSLETGISGSRLRLDTPEGAFPIRSPLVGAFNGWNLAAAWGAATALGAGAAEAAEALSGLSGPPGRMERIGSPAEGPTVLVDYAHTPDALARALAEGRVLVGRGRLAAVFGCGGDRDRDKRPLMGDAAARLADRVVVTSDNPRREDPEAIIADIRRGTDNPLLPARIETEPDRAQAIARAVLGAAPSDLVLIAGRGHETHQETAGGRIPLDDRTLAAAAIRRRMPA